VRREFRKFSIAVDPGDGTFTDFPTEFQKDWLLGRAVREFADDLEHLEEVGRHIIPGVERPAIDAPWEKSGAG
jgi:guanidinoacetate N-methyltransferase